jgi:choline dehydrogenase-like flavoprotein
VREWVPNSGWPITRAELDPYYRRAHEILRLGAFDYDATGWEQRGQGIPMRLDAERLGQGVFQMRASRLGVVYRDEVLGLPNVRTLIHSNVVELETSPGSGVISRARVATLDGNAFAIQSRIYILACGGIENARVLLASRSGGEMGLGNEHDLVGRFFMEHLELDWAAEFLPLDARFDPTFYVPHMPGELQVFGALIPPPQILQANGMLSCGMTLTPRFPAYLDEAASSEGWESFRALGRRVFGRESGGPLTSHLWNVLRNLDRVAGAAYGRLAASRVLRQFGVKVQVEQLPNRDSRVTLHQNLDALGVPKARLDWRVSDQDFQTIRGGLELLAREVGRAGVGRVQIPDRIQDRPWEDAVVGAWHHMGTTRMADDPTMGVVNQDCRVHSLANLYVAGSSVFPTVGFANPTLTLTALAVRLGEHIREGLR